MDGLAIFLIIFLATIWISPKSVGIWLAKCRTAYLRALQSQEAGNEG